MGHDHLVAAHEFAGEPQLTSDSINPASLELTVKAASMSETNPVFTEQQKQIINIGEELCRQIRACYKQTLVF